MSSVNLSRRAFLKSTTVVGGGLILGFNLPACSSLAASVDTSDGSAAPNAFIQIKADNSVVFYCPRDEMGQGITTGLGTLVGEELDIDPGKLQVKFPGAHRDYVNPHFKIQSTGASSSMRVHYKQLRQAGADARGLLIKAAATDLGLQENEIETDDGWIIAGGNRHPYGQFVETARSLPAPKDTRLKKNQDFKYIGKAFPGIDAVQKVTGQAEFGIDIDLPGMHHGVVRRSPVPGAKLKHCDQSKALAMPGVTDVVEISSGVAVVAESFWQAKLAAAQLVPEWHEAPLSQLNTESLRQDYADALAKEKGVSQTDEGDVDLGLQQASYIAQGEYWAPLLAHAPLEPMNAVVRIENGEADVWSGTQGIGMARGLVSRFSGIAKEKVRAHNTYLGGGFGRRGTLTHVIEATELAVATNKPIHLLWTREDDIRHGVYRPASLMDIRAGADPEGQLTLWEAKRVGGNISPRTVEYMMPGIFPGLADGMVDFVVDVSEYFLENWVVDYTSIEGLYEDYSAPNKLVKHITLEHGIPLTFWRSVGHSYTAFAKESMMDELAEKVGIDEVEFRLKNTQENPSLNQVIKVAQQKMNEMVVPQGHYLGFAAHNCFSTDVAEIAEVSVTNNQIKVHKVTCVVDCGLAINPDIIIAQMEGAIVFGLTAALYGDLVLEGGEIQQSNFHDYQMLRMNEAPKVDVVIIDSEEDPTGVGEPGLPPIAPAVANAVYKATGQRLKSLPLKLA